MNWITLAVCHVSVAVLCVILAMKKGYAPVTWCLLALPFGVVALFVLLALPPRKEGPAERSGREA